MTQSRAGQLEEFKPRNNYYSFVHSGRWKWVCDRQRSWSEKWDSGL